MSFIGNLGTLNDPLLLRICELLLYIWKQVFVIVILINTVQRYFFYFIGQNIWTGKWITENRPPVFTFCPKSVGTPQG